MSRVDAPAGRVDHSEAAPGGRLDTSRPAIARSVAPAIGRAVETAAAPVASTPVADLPVADAPPAPAVSTTVPGRASTPAAEPVRAATRPAGTVHMIGNAHIDPVWLWRWPEGYQEVRATFSAALDRMEEYPDFFFTSDSVAYFEQVEEHDPELFERIRARIAEGRWEVVGGWWVEPDCNTPSGESFVRQALYGQRWLFDRFGITSTTGANVDPFGHAATLPQLLARAGMDSYVFLRPQEPELPLPLPYFHWRTPDGSSVLAVRIPNEYTATGQDLYYHVGRSLSQLPGNVGRDLLVFYGVGNHGGGPTRANIDSIHRMADRDLFPAMELSTIRRFADAALAGPELAARTGEMQPHGVGCYSAHSEVKRLNRRAESALGVAETWATVAAVVAGMPSGRAEIEHAWKQVLFNQFHDILAGTSIESAYDDARDSYGEALAIAARVANRSIQSLSRRVAIDLVEGTVPLVVFNPHPWPVAATVEVEFGAFLTPVDATDSDGAPVPLQVVRSQSTESRWRRLAIAVELPALGYRLYRLGSRGPTPDDHTVVRPVTEPLTLANDRLRAVVDPATGRLSSLRAVGGPELLDPAAPHAVVLDDATDTWGHGVRSFSRVAGVFTPVRTRVVDSGPVRTTVRVDSTFGSSTLVEEYVLDAAAGFLEVRVTVDWHEELRALKLRFPTVLDDVTATHEIPYGTLERPTDGIEVPSQRWVDLSGRVGGEPAGLSLLNDAKYGFDVLGGDLGMTCVRSPVYAWHDPEPLDGDGLYHHLDTGLQRFTYRLLPHAGDRQVAGTARAAAELDRPVTPLLESAHPGPLPPSASWASVDSPAVALTVLKTGEDRGEDVVLRLVESTGAAVDTVVRLPLLGRDVTVALAPTEIVTLLVPRDPAAPAVATDLLEWDPATHRPFPGPAAP